MSNNFYGSMHAIMKILKEKDIAITMDFDHLYYKAKHMLLMPLIKKVQLMF